MTRCFIIVYRSSLYSIVQHASLLAASAQAAEVSELTRKLRLADEEVVRINKRFEETRVGTDEVESLKSALAEAKKEAEASKAAADKAAKNLEEEQTTRRRHEARVGEVEKELKDAISKCKFLEQKSSEQASELTNARESLKEARVDAQGARQEIQEARRIAAGAFANLPRSIVDAAAFFRAEEGSSTEKLFWSQYLAPELPMPLSDELKQLSELHRVAGLAMKDVIVRLWPAEAIPSSHFGLVKRLVEALPRIDAIKRSSRIEGARMAFARVKVQWEKMKATEIATTGPPEGKEHRRPERYFGEVLEGARIVEGQCSKDIIFE